MCSLPYGLPPNTAHPLFVAQIQSVGKKLTKAERLEVFFRKHITSEVQVGPTCGFVAIRMALHALSIERGIPFVPELVELAKSLAFTAYGELFSAEWMAEIINKVTSLASAFASKEFPKPGDFVRHLALVKNSENSNPDGIQQQSTILVPYDCDRNFEPCERGGFLSHWGVIVGFLLIKQAKNDGSESDENDGKIIDFKPYKFDDDEELSSIDPECFYLIAYQGKSRRPALWSYEQLWRSNAQLKNAKSAVPIEFCLPPGGSEEGLCRKCVFVSPKKQ